MSIHRPQRSVAILQTYIPQYRVPLYAELSETLRGEGINLTVAAGDPWPSHRGRGDERKSSGTTVLKANEVTVLGRRISLRETWNSALSADLLIVEDALGNADVFRYLLSRRRRGYPTAFWGQGIPRGASKLGIHLRAWLRSQSDWYFAYTEAGASEITRLGYPSDRVTVLNNAIDVEPLVRITTQLTEHRRAQLRQDLHLTRGHTALYLGALHKSKRLEFLIAAADRVAENDDHFRLLIVGDGTLRNYIHQAGTQRPWMQIMGPVFDDQTKAELMAISDMITAPGTIGLLAVDSLGLGVPIITTESNKHGPEFGYLTNGKNALVVAGGISEYAQAVQDVIRDSDLQGRLVAECLKDRETYTIAKMGKSFSQGIQQALHAQR